MIKSDNIVKIGTRFKLCKQQSTYRESHDGDGGDWNWGWNSIENSLRHGGSKHKLSSLTQTQTTSLKLLSVTMFVRRKISHHETRLRKYH